MGLDYRQRAEANFQASCEAMSSAIAALTARHAADGVLQSGATIRKALAIYEEETSKALTQTLNEIAKHIEHRGRAWRTATIQVRSALESHLATTPAPIERALHFAVTTGDNAAKRAADTLLRASADRLRTQLTEFVDGWTAPKAKPWKERHPNLDRFVFLIIGAAITAGAGLLGKALWQMIKRKKGQLAAYDA
jgi:hypothetical protein